MILYHQNLKNLFTRIASNHSHDTRAAAAGKFHIISFTDKTAGPILVKTWSYNLQFKRHLQTKLLQFLVHEGVYLDVHNLADKLFLD